eukprot:183849-Rhodomonas_salina.1
MRVRACFPQQSRVSGCGFRVSGSGLEITAGFRVASVGARRDVMIERCHVVRGTWGHTERGAVFRDLRSSTLGTQS